jgi:hypothetical protein
MLYPFMTLNDHTEIVYSSPIEDGDQEYVKVYAETPIDGGFKSAWCMLPDEQWTNNGYSKLELDYLKDLVKDVAHILIQLSREGGIESAQAI